MESLGNKKTGYHQLQKQIVKFSGTQVRLKSKCHKELEEQKEAIIQSIQFSHFSYIWNSSAAIVLQE